MNGNKIPVQETDKSNGFPPVLFFFSIVHVLCHVDTHTHTQAGLIFYESVSNSICCVVAAERKDLIMNSLGAVKTPN